MHRRRRTSKLPKPSLQSRFCAVFAGVLLLSLLLQYALLSSRLTFLALELPSDGPLLIEGANRVLWSSLVLTCLVVLPLTCAAAVLTTFRIVGPIHRFEKFFRALAAGEDAGVLRIRQGDQLQELCDLINAALERVRSEPAATRPAQAASEAVPSLVAPAEEHDHAT